MLECWSCMCIYLYICNHQIRCGKWPWTGWFIPRRYLFFSFVCTSRSWRVSVLSWCTRYVFVDIYHVIRPWCRSKQEQLHTNLYHTGRTNNNMPFVWLLPLFANVATCNRKRTQGINWWEICWKLAKSQNIEWSLLSLASISHDMTFGGMVPHKAGERVD